MDPIERIEDMIYQEIDNIGNQGNLSMDCLKVLSELIDIIKDCAEIRMYDNVTPGEYANDRSFSYDNNSNGNMNWGYSQRKTPIYYGGNSYRNNGYTRRGGRSGYSRDDAKDHMIMKLESLMNDAQDEHDRQAIKKLIDQIGME